MASAIFRCVRAAASSLLLLALAAACGPAGRDGATADAVAGGAGRRAAAEAGLGTDLDRWPFGASEMPWPGGAADSSRMRLLRREVAKGFPVPASWRSVLAAAPAGLDRLRAVNGLVNTRPYHADDDDEWRTPAVFLAEGGDCDCFAVAKYVLLRSMGVAARDLRITAVQRRREGDLHVVVVARTGPGRFATFVLDNATDYPRTALYMSIHVPLLSLNEDSVWIHDLRGADIADRFIDPATR